ncbi:MAG: 23S rRNA (adenine(1618)-N(6))-methyltransferase RlmF [Campylobacterota bacterium]|nr:23S rRNA (adenine(1618)-N(6))-methyltransferase RlmF [Campylobacterota bacterium]
MPNTKQLHKNNIHNKSYDFKELIKVEPKLKEFVKLNKYDNLSIDFSNPKAVKLLNKSLLNYHYNIKHWDIPDNYLCPPIPGRADYIHYIAELLESKNNKTLKGLDIGVGANCIYPIIGVCSYNWSFVGSDIDIDSINNCKKIIDSNSILKDKIELRIQKDKDNIFDGVIDKNDKFDFTMCNPPFHKSQREALKGSIRKVKNLSKKDIKSPTLNFQGKPNELWCEGGELSFIKKMIIQSKKYKENCQLFTTLVSKKENLPILYKFIKKETPKRIETIEMIQGNKITRFIAWSF